MLLGLSPLLAVVPIWCWVGVWIIAGSSNPEIRPVWTLWWRKAPEQTTWEAYIRRLEKDCGIDWAESWFYDPDIWPIAPAPARGGQPHTVTIRRGHRYHRYADGKMVFVGHTGTSPDHKWSRA